MSGKNFSGFYQCPYILVACKMDIPCSTCEDFHTYIKEENLLRTTQQGMPETQDINE
jgi:hypothetical protein